jgi:hypothetical protein
MVACLGWEAARNKATSFVKQLVFVFDFCFVSSVAIGHTTIDLNILPEIQPASEVQYGPV